MKSMLEGSISFVDNLSIRTKLILNVVGIILILGILMGSYLNVVQTNMMKSELNEKGISITRNLAKNSVNPILTDDQVSLQWLVETIKDSESDVVYVFINNGDGEVMAHTFSNGFPVDLKGMNPAVNGTSNILIDTEKGRIRDISYPILDGSVGEVHVGMSQERIRSTVDKFTTSLILFVLLLMVVGTNVAYLAGSVVSRPIIELKGGVETFGEGDLDHRVAVNSSNEVGQLAGSFNDMADHICYLIMEKEKASKEILETRNYLTRIVSGSLDGIVVADQRGRIEFSNEAFSKIAESSEDELKGCDISSFFMEGEDDIKAFLDSRGTDETFMDELVFNTMDGKLKSVILSMAIVEYRNEFKYVAVAKDITEIKRLEQMKRNIISNISHELRTPLNIMKGFVEISMDEKDDEMRKNFLNKSLKALEKQNWMIQDLLEVARGEGNMEDLDLVKTSINNVVDMSFKVFNGKLETSGLEVIKKLEKDRFIKADPEKLVYALTKIIDNALKFTDKDGCVEIGTLYYEDEAVVYVKDNGIGIPRDKLGNIFEQFYQIDGTSTRKYGGNGLGLSIAKDIIDMHGGRLWVESVYNEGSTFYFSVPPYTDDQ